MTTLPDGRLLVRSERLRLPWSARAGRAAGTAVLIDGAPFQVVERQRAGGGEAWTLQPWSEDDAMRGVFTLDEAWVAGLEQVRVEERTARLRWWLLPVVPLLETPRQSAVDDTAPEVGGLDRTSGSLELSSPIHRADWVADGVLWYRDEPYRLASVGREGRRWIYTFGRCDAAAAGPALRLLPPASRPLPSTRGRPPNLARTAVATALACLAPRDLQEAWASRIDVRPALLTILGAGAECCGALVNLQSGAAGGSSIALALNLVVLVEGMTRFTLLLGSGRPVGSVLGLALRPLLVRLLADSPSTPHP